MEKQRNYTIEFYRIMFAVNFVAVHVYMVYSMATTRQMVHIYALDNIMPFMIFAGYFLMYDFKRQQQRSLAQGVTPGTQAGRHLKSRVISLLPAFLVAQIGGFAATNIFITKTSFISWPLGLLNHIGELIGLQIIGIGFGNAFVGNWGEGVRVVQLLNAPLWFISGIFVVGYIIYYLLAKCENLYICFIGPVFALIFYASQHLANSNPFWYNSRFIGDFAYVEGFPHMFVGLTIGCIMWLAVNRLKDKAWSGGMKAFMTIVAFIFSFILIYKTWVPVNIPVWGSLININWASVHIISIFCTFFVLLGADGFNRLLNRKIWAVPGRLAFYIYMFHYPIIVAVGNIMNIRSADGLTTLYIVSTLVTIVFSYLFMLLNNHVIQPWLKNMPWYSVEQKELELAKTES